MDGNILKEGHGLLHCHVQHIINALVLIFHLQRLTVVPLALAHLAGYVYVRQEVHLNLDDSITAAGLTSAALHIKAEAAFLIALGLGISSGSKQVTDLIKDSCVGGRIGSGVRPIGDWSMAITLSS